VDLESLYGQHYATMVRAAVLLVRDLPTAEDVVQEAFAGIMGREPRDPAAYLRRSVVNGCASVLRRRGAAERAVLVDVPWGMEHGAMLDGNAVIAALDVLPPRRREAVVLRYYLGLSEKEAASAMGCAPGSVRSHAARGLAALHWTVEELRAEAETYLESRSRTDRSKMKLFS
jgi:DNA-directed RNA polymerase specialized sigma24 family protein